MIRVHAKSDLKKAAVPFWNQTARRILIPGKPLPSMLLCKGVNHDANLAFFKVDIFELEVSDFTSAASGAYGNSSAVHCQLPILVCQSRGDQCLNLILACHLAGARCLISRRG